MKLTVTFALGALLSFSTLVQAKETITCRQIKTLSKMVEQGHALSRDPELREKLLNDRAFAQSLREGFVEALDQSRTLLLADEVALAHEGLAGNVASAVFSRGECGGFTKVFGVYKAAVERSLRLVPVRAGQDDPLKIEIIEAASRLTHVPPMSKEWAKSEGELVQRTKDLLTRGTFALAGAMGKGGPPNFAKAYDLARMNVDHIRQKAYAEDEVPRVMTNVILEHLDPHTAYFGEEELSNYLGSMEEFAGLGVQISQGLDGVHVESILPNGPAARAGLLKEGDVIIKVDGEAVTGLDIGEVSKRLKGAVNTHVKLEVLRATEPKPLEIDLVRGRVSPQEMTFREVVDTPSGPVGYLRFTHFGKNGAKAVAGAIDELEKKGIRGLVLDLRGNPGGILEEAIAMVGLFNREAPAPAVFYVGSNEAGPVAYTFKNDAGAFKRPLVVLVDATSASAAEVVSGALQKYGRALIVGDGPTFGKGSVQTIYSMAEYARANFAFKMNYMLGLAPTGGLKVTTGLYFLPDGTSIQNVGVTPDLVLYPERAADAEVSEKGMFEHSLAHPSDLPGRLIPPAVVAPLKPLREKMTAVRDVIAPSLAEKREELRKVNPQDPEKAASIFVLEELIKHTPGA